MITVDSVIQDYGFETSIFAGRAGGNRPLSRAHLVDLGDPWNWIGPGELILTTGGGIPAPGRQEQWMRQVIVSGANGLLVAPRPGTRDLTEAALSVADSEAAVKEQLWALLKPIETAPTQIHATRRPKELRSKCRRGHCPAAWDTRAERNHLSQLRPRRSPT